MFRGHKFLVGFILISISLLSGPVSAAEGRVVFIKGGVNLEFNNKNIIAKEGSAIQDGTIVKTASDGYVRWQMPDESSFSLKPDSVFTVQMHKFDASKAQENKAIYKFVKGGFNTISGLIGGNNKGDYKVETTYATMGIRGTEYTAVILSESEASALGVEPGLYVSVTSGSVVITNEQGTQIVAAGEIAFVGENTAPTLIPNAPGFLINIFSGFESSISGNDSGFGMEGDIEIDVDVEHKDPSPS